MGGCGSVDLAMKIVETTVFTKQIDRLIGEDSKQKLLDELIANPAAGDLIRGSGGLRKLRWNAPGKGKRGGIRVIYYFHPGQIMYLLLAYPKSKKDDLSGEEIRILRSVVQEEKWSWRRTCSES
jgi:hypothetical protein